MKKRWIAIFGLCLMTFTGTACARPAQKESAELVQNPPVREPCPEDPLRLTQKSLDDKAFDL